MLSMMQRPGISHVKLSKMNFMGMGPWMIGKLSKQYNVASPTELLEACQLMGVEFMPCQMTMDMFGLKREDMIDGLGDPVGAATVLELREILELQREEPHLGTDFEAQHLALDVLLAGLGFRRDRRS